MANKAAKGAGTIRKKTVTRNGKDYTFAMNGQTGKLVGDLPMDRGAYNKYLWMTTAIGAAAVFAVQYLIWLL